MEGDGWSLEAVHTPGHATNHLCYLVREEGSLCTGDHVMGWSTTVVSPPDGNLAEYMASLEKLLTRPQDRRYVPAHGPPITDPHTVVRDRLAHRRERTEQILDALATGPATIVEIVPRLYADVPKQVWPAAAASVYAHLLQLHELGLVEAEDGPLRREPRQAGSLSVGHAKRFTCARERPVRVAHVARVLARGDQAVDAVRVGLGRRRVEDAGLVSGAERFDERRARDPPHLHHHLRARPRHPVRGGRQLRRPPGAPGFVEHVEVPLEPGFEGGDGVGGLGHGAGEGAPHRRRLPQHERLEEGLLRLEVAIEGARRQTGFVEHVPEGERGVVTV